MRRIVKDRIAGQYSYFFKKIILFLLFCLVGGGFFISTVCHSDEKVFSFGVVPQFDTRRIHDIWQPILNQLDKEFGIQLRLVSSSSIPAFENSFLKGSYDLAYMNPYHLLVANKAQGYFPIVMDTGRQLYGIIVVRSDSPIQDVKELYGKTIAFPAPNALGAALIPRAEFAKKFKIKFTPKYVKSHTSVYLNVMLRQADAGGGVQKTFARQKEKISKSLRILYKTESVSPHPIAVHPRVRIETAERIRAAFIALGKTDQGRSMFKKIPMEQIGPASMEDYAALKSMGLDEFYVRSDSK